MFHNGSLKHFPEEAAMSKKSGGNGGGSKSGGGSKGSGSGKIFNNPQSRVKTWTNKTTGQYNQKVVKGPDAGTHRGYETGNRKEFHTGTKRYRDSDSSSGSSGSSGSSSGCYIATAVLANDPGGEFKLDVLRHWRNNKLESTRAGRALSAHYREIAPDVAAFVATHERLGRLFRIVLIEPGYKLVSRSTSGWKALIRDCAAFSIFLVGLVAGKVIRRCIRS